LLSEKIITIDKMKIYTRTGDDGTTSLAGGKRVPKHDLRVEAYGSVDELIAWIGMLRSHNFPKERKELLIAIQDQLMRCACLLAHPADAPDPSLCMPEQSFISLLEKEMDEMEAKLPPIKNFILPGGDRTVSDCNVARCVCRRAERSVLRLKSVEYVPEIICKLLNRLSDFLFMMTRMTGFELDIEEVKWKV
jgi:cob(I)alamin adenosyltransferase